MISKWFSFETSATTQGLNRLNAIDQHRPDCENVNSQGSYFVRWKLELHVV